MDQTELLNRLREHLRVGTTDMAPNSLRVPASHYVSETQLTQELDALFIKRPLLVALTPNFPNAGDYLTHEVLKTSLLLVRGKDGQARAFINACRHRGARIAEGSGSKQSFSCPFHAWNWGLDGKLIGRPNSSGGFDDVGDVYDQLLEVACYETAGLVFVLLEGDEDDKDGIEVKVRRMMGEALDDIAGFDIPNTQYFDSRTVELDCNYKFFLDGFAETYHIPPLHKGSINPYYYAGSTLVDSVSEVVRLISPRRTIDKEFEKPPEEQNQVLAYTTTEYLIAPNVLLTHQVDHIQFWRVYPLDGAQRCRIELNVFWPKPMDEEAWRKGRLNVDLVWEVSTKEDFPQSVSIHSNLVSGKVPELVFGRNEPGLIQYHLNIAKAIGSKRLIAVG